MVGARALVSAELRAFRSYLARPRARIRDAGVATPRQRWLIALVSLIALDCLVILPIGVTSSWLGMTNLNDDMSNWKALLLGVLAAPIIEEWIFRAGLRSPRYSLFVGPVLIVLIAAASFEAALVSLIIAVVALLVASILRIRFRQNGRAAAAFRRQYLRRFPFVFYGYAAAFAIVHAINWSSPSAVGWLVMPLLVVPQFYFGLVAGYLRIRDSLRSAILLHMASNALAFAVGAVFT